MSEQVEMRRRGECSCLPLPEPTDDLCPLHGDVILSVVAYAMPSDLQALRLAAKHGDGVTVPVWMAPPDTLVRERFTIPLWVVRTQIPGEER